MTLHKPDANSQWTAIFFVVWGTLTVCLGSSHNWKEVMTMGAGVCGAGIQAFTTYVSGSKQE